MISDNTNQYIDDYTPLYEMPMKQRQQNVQHLPTPNGEAQEMDNGSLPPQPQTTQTIDISNLIHQQDDICAEMFYQNIRDDPNGDIDYTAYDLPLSNHYSEKSSVKQSPKATKKDVNLVQNDSSIHHIPKLDTEAKAKLRRDMAQKQAYHDYGQQLQQQQHDVRNYLMGSAVDQIVENENYQDQNDLNNVVLRNNESKESLMQSLKLINFPSSTQNSFVKPGSHLNSQNEDFDTLHLPSFSQNHVQLHSHLTSGESNNAYGCQQMPTIDNQNQHHQFFMANMSTIHQNDNSPHKSSEKSVLSNVSQRPGIFQNKFMQMMNGEKQDQKMINQGRYIPQSCDQPQRKNQAPQYIHPKQQPHQTMTDSKKSTAVTSQVTGFKLSSTGAVTSERSSNVQFIQTVVQDKNLDMPMICTPQGEENDETNANQKLMDELAKLKSEISHLKLQQNEHSQVYAQHLMNNQSLSVNGGMNFSQLMALNSHRSIQQNNKITPRTHFSQMSKQTQNSSEAKINELQSENSRLREQVQALQAELQEKDQRIEEMSQELSKRNDNMTNMQSFGASQKEISNMEAFENQIDTYVHPASQEEHVIENIIDGSSQLLSFQNNPEIENMLLGGQEQFEQSNTFDKFQQNKSKREEIANFLNSDMNSASTKNVISPTNAEIPPQQFVNSFLKKQPVNKRPPLSNRMMQAQGSKTQKQTFSRKQTDSIGVPQQQHQPPMVMGQRSNSLKGPSTSQQPHPNMFYKYQKIRSTNRSNASSNERSQRNSVSKKSGKSYRQYLNVNRNNLPSQLSNERIQNLFQDQMIKAQSFIDILDTNNNKNGLIRLQNGKTSLKKQAQDVYNALQQLKNELQDQGTILQIQRIMEPEKNALGTSPASGQTNSVGAESMMYEIQVPNLKVKCDDENAIVKMKVKLSLSGGQLMIKTGGGFRQLLEWLEEKKVINSNY